MSKILIMDDEDSVRWLLRKILEQAGHTIIDAPDGEIGLKLYRKELPDLVIVDLVMPKKTGFDVIVELKRDFPASKIIAITGGASSLGNKPLALAKDLGAKRIFQKTDGMDLLVPVVEDLLRERR